MSECFVEGEEWRAGAGLVQVLDECADGGRTGKIMCVCVCVCVYVCLYVCVIVCL